MDIDELERSKRRADLALALAVGLTFAGYIQLVGITQAWAQAELEASYPGDDLGRGPASPSGVYPQ